jgi:hypothetical protein
MRIRHDFGGHVYVGGHRLRPGDKVPAGAAVSDWLLDGGSAGSNSGEPQKPSRSATKTDWFNYAESVGVTEDGATIDDYTKDDLIDLVG